MKIEEPKWTTTVDPSEYDYIDQFNEMVKLANKRKETYCEMDVGKVWGLVKSHQRLEEKIEELGKKIDDLEIELFERKIKEVEIK